MKYVAIWCAIGFVFIGAVLAHGRINSLESRVELLESRTDGIEGDIQDSGVVPGWGTASGNFVRFDPPITTLRNDLQSLRQLLKAHGIYEVEQVPTIKLDLNKSVGKRVVIRHRNGVIEVGDDGTVTREKEGGE